mgnify:FL=1
MNKRAHILVQGIVQGVFFRHNTMIKAQELGLKGWVRNLRDKRVEIICEGAETEIVKMIDWCKRGPKGAYVEKIETQWEDYRGEFNSFEIIY